VRETSSALAAILLLGALTSARGQYVEDSIDVGGNFVGRLAYNPSRDVVYGASNTGDVVFAVDCATNTVISRVAVNYPRGLAYSSRDDKLYCAFGYGDESLLVVSGLTHQRLGAIPLGGANILVWDSIYNRIYVSSESRWEVSVVDCTTDSVIAVIRVGDSPLQMHINTRRRKLYVQNDDSHDISIIDMQRNEVLRTLNIGEPPVSGWYSLTEDKYICGGYTRVFTIGGGTDTLRSVLTLEDPGKTWSIAGDDAARLAYIGSEGLAHNSLLTFDVVAETVVVQEVMPGVPRFVFRSEPSSLVYVLCRNSWVSVCAPDGHRTGCSLAVQSSPFVAAYSPPTRRLYVGHLNSSLVYVIKDTVTGLVEQESPSASAAPVLGVSGSCFRNRVVAELDVPAGIDVPALLVLTSDGRLVVRLSGMRTAGRVRYTWAGLDGRGNRAPRGVYVLRPSDCRVRAASVVKVE
jgi:YVTN family beta-propeller protein